MAVGTVQGRHRNQEQVCQRNQRNGGIPIFLQNELSRARGSRNLVEYEYAHDQSRLWLRRSGIRRKICQGELGRWRRNRMERPVADGRTGGKKRGGSDQGGIGVDKASSSRLVLLYSARL